MAGITEEAAEAPKGITLSAYVLFSEGVQFRPSEIAEALAEDYPALEVEDTLGVATELNEICDTDGTVVATLPMWGGTDGQPVSIMRLPGYGQWDPEQLTLQQRMRWPDIEQALAHNRSYISITVSFKPDDDLVTRFRAARLLSCVSAVFARLPVALGVYWDNADHFLSPEQMIAAADTAIADGWALDEWIGVRLAGGTAEDGTRMTQAMTHGAKAFVGQECSFASAPVAIEEAMNWAMAVPKMICMNGSVFNDGDTISLEGRPREESIKIRIAPEGTVGSDDPFYLVVHPTCPMDIDAFLGPQAVKELPPEQREVRHPRPGFFKRLIRGRRDS